MLPTQGSVAILTVFILRGSTADAQTDTNFIVSSTNASVAKIASASSHHSRKFLPVTRMVPTEVCAKCMDSACVSSPSEDIIMILLISDYVTVMESADGKFDTLSGYTRTLS